MRGTLLLLLLLLAAATEAAEKDPSGDDGPVDDLDVLDNLKVEGPPICPEGFVCIPFEGDEAALPPEWLVCGAACTVSASASVQDVMISLLLLAHSGMFSGLTLGLMSLDLAGLRIVISGGSPEEAECALKILPLRKRGNLLLCTLLIGNTLVNAAFAIFSASFTGGLAGTLISTGFIVIVGEITPQSVRLSAAISAAISRHFFSRHSVPSTLSSVSFWTDLPPNLSPSLPNVALFRSARATVSTSAPSPSQS